MWQDTGLNGDAQRIEQLGWMLFLKIFSTKEIYFSESNPAYQAIIPIDLNWNTWANAHSTLTGKELQQFIDLSLFPRLRAIDIDYFTGENRFRAAIVKEVFQGNNYMKNGENIRKVLNQLNQVDFDQTKDRHALGDLYESMLQELQSAGKSGEFYTPRAITGFIVEIIDPCRNEKIIDPSCGTGGYLTAALEHVFKKSPSDFQKQQFGRNLIGWEYKPLPYLLAITNLILHDVELPHIRFIDSLSKSLDDYRDEDKCDIVLANPPFGGIVNHNNEKNFPESYRTRESVDLFLMLIMHLLKPGGRAGLVIPDGTLTGDGVKKRIRKKLLEECSIEAIVRLPNSVFQPYAAVSTNLIFFTKGSPTKEIWYYQLPLPIGQKAYSKTKPIKKSEFNLIKKWWKNKIENEHAWKVSIDTIMERDYDLDIGNPSKQNDILELSSRDLLEQLERSFRTSNELLINLRDELQ